MQVSNWVRNDKKNLNDVHYNSWFKIYLYNGYGVIRKIYLHLYCDLFLVISSLYYVFKLHCTQHCSGNFRSQIRACTWISLIPYFTWAVGKLPAVDAYRQRLWNIMIPIVTRRFIRSLGYLAEGVKDKHTWICIAVFAITLCNLASVLLKQIHL